MAETIPHSEGGVAIVGTRLTPEDTIKKGDKFNAPDGTWKTCDFMADRNWKVGPNCTSIWVREAPKAE